MDRTYSQFKNQGGQEIFLSSELWNKMIVRLGGSGNSKRLIYYCCLVTKSRGLVVCSPPGSSVHSFFKNFWLYPMAYGT